MATLNATKLLLLTKQRKLILTITLTLTNNNGNIFYAHFVDNHKKVVSHEWKEFFVDVLSGVRG